MCVSLGVGNHSASNASSDHASRRRQLKVGWGSSELAVADAARTLARRWVREAGATDGALDVRVLGVTLGNFEKLEKEGRGGGIARFFAAGSAAAPKPRPPAPPAKTKRPADFFAPRPSPKRRSPEDADVDDRWTCSACTYAHVGAEAGFLACAICAAERPGD